MSQKKFNVKTSDIIAEIRNLLSQKQMLSVAHMDTYYLYDSDLHVVAMLNRTVSVDGNHDYRVQIPILGSKSKYNESCVEYRNFYKLVNDSYNLKRVGPVKNPEFKYGASDAVNLAQNLNANASTANRISFIENLIVQLIKNQCPVDLIKRVFYYFDNPNEKTERFPPEFTMLNHGSKLVEYTTARQHLWGFVNDKYAHSLSPMDKEMQKVFDKVKSALQNQRAK